MQKTPAFCAGNVHSPGASQERVEDDVQVLAPLVLGLSANGSAHIFSLLFISSMFYNKKLNIMFHVKRCCAIIKII